MAVVTMKRIDLFLERERITLFADVRVAAADLNPMNRLSFYH